MKISMKEKGVHVVNSHIGYSDLKLREEANANAEQELRGAPAALIKDCNAATCHKMAG